MTQRRLTVPGAMTRSPCWPCWLALLAVAAAVWMPLPVNAFAELIIQQGQMIQVRGEAGPTTDQVSEFPGGATLSTDPEVDRLLKRAGEYVLDKRYDLAVEVWQKVLDGTNSVLRTSDGQHYTSVQDYVETQLERMAREAPGGLREYRIKADAQARELLAQSTGANEEKGLADIERRYFYSTLGDDAAYTLGCLMLDRYEFVAATRYFTDILARHPDYIMDTGSAPNLSRGDVLVRLAVAAARAGDPRLARAALEQHAKLANAAESADVLAWVDRAIQDGGAAIDVAGTAPGEWTLAHGSPANDGRMTGLPAATKYSGVWQERWIAHFSDGGFGFASSGAAPAAAPTPRLARLGNRAMVTTGPARPAGDSGSDDRRRGLVQKWESSDWLPKDSMLMHAGRVYVRAYDRVMCLDGRTGKHYFSSPSKVMPQVRPFANSSVEEVLLFGDGASGSMSIHDGVLYYLEEDSTSHLPQNNSYFRNRTGIAAYRPQLANRLVALDATNGKLQWRSKPDTDENGTMRPVRYQSAPVAYGNLLLTPVIDNGALWLYARRADREGELAWKKFLADDPPGGYNPWVTTGLAVAGGDAYLVSSGVVFNIDANSGLVRWASRYQRDADGSFQRTTAYNQATPSPRGWDHDFVIPVGAALIVAPNDRDWLMAFDRRSGRQLWEIPRDQASHVLGAAGKHLFVAGRDRLRKYDMQHGTLVREVALEYPVSGRGFVADDAVYLPHRAPGTSAIARYHLNTFKQLSIVGVSLDIADSDGRFDYFDPIGNIYSDGQRIYGVGMERVYALGPASAGAADNADLDDDLTALVPGGTPRPSSGDLYIDVLLEHGVEPTKEALDTFLRDLHPSPQKRKLVDQLIDELGDESYPRRVAAQKKLLMMPVLPVEAIVQATKSDDQEVRTAAERILRAVDGKRSRLLHAALVTIRKKSIKGLAEPTLASVPLCTQKYLLDAAGLAMKATASADDAPHLRAALAGESPQARAIAALAIGAVLKDKATKELAALAKDSQEHVRLAAARAMADYGERASLPMLIALLESQDVMIRSSAVGVLRASTGQRHDFVPYHDAEQRKAALQKWKGWVAAHGATAKLTFPLPDTRFRLGRTLIANYRSNRVYELDDKDSETWSINVQNPWGVLGLPNGHRLVSSYTARTVVEYDAAGEEVWKQENLPSAPFSVERLENGNTLIACSNSNRVVEVDMSNKVVWDQTIIGRPTLAHRLPNGRTLIALQNGHRVVEINHAGKEEWSINNLRSPICAQRLSNGNTLVAEVSGGGVREFDNDGKQVWSLNTIEGRNIQTPYFVERQDNGNTLVADSSGIYEVTPEGQVVWKRLEQGVTRVSRY